MHTLNAIILPVVVAGIIIVEHAHSIIRAVAVYRRFTLVLKRRPLTETRLIIVDGYDVHFFEAGRGRRCGGSGSGGGRWCRAVGLRAGQPLGRRGPCGELVACERFVVQKVNFGHRSRGFCLWHCREVIAITIESVRRLQRLFIGVVVENDSESSRIVFERVQIRNVFHLPPGNDPNSAFAASAAGGNRDRYHDYVGCVVRGGKRAADVLEVITGDIVDIGRVRGCLPIVMIISVIVCVESGRFDVWLWRVSQM